MYDVHVSVKVKISTLIRLLMTTQPLEHSALNYEVSHFWSVLIQAPLESKTDFCEKVCKFTCVGKAGVFFPNTL